jgi:Pyruvate/2-oxoacid:ferredoxin oxidoreductase delta subunit
VTAYRNADIFFMSGTGNTFRVARVFAEKAAAAGADVSMTPMGRSARPRRIEGGASRLLVLATPTHGFTAPWLAIWFALRLPRGRGVHAIAVATRAGTKAGPVFLPGLDGTTVYLLALILFLKGYRVRGAIGIDMPSNWLAVHPGFKRANAGAIIARSRPTLLRFIGRILAGRRFFGSWVSFPFGILLFPVSLGYLLYGRAMFGKLFFATKKCNGCGLCAKYCQHRAVVMRGSPPRPYWTYRCESCMRCMAYCPKEAVEVSHSFAVIMGVALSVYPPLVAAAMVSRMSGLAGSAAGRFVLPLLNYAAWLGGLMLLYVLFWTLTGWKAPNILFKWTTFTPLFRRYREPGTKMADMTRWEEWKGKRGRIIPWNT